MSIESTFSIPKLRCGHKLDIGAYSAYWFEMDHPGESPRSLLDIFDLYLNRFNWDKFIRPGSTIIDVGAHSGDTAVPMQYLSHGTVLAIEPNPIIRPYLEFCCNMNSHLGKFIVASEAVTTEDVDSLEILDHNNALCNGGAIDPSWSTALQDRMRASAGNSFTTRGLTLENICNKYLTEEEIENISFIKTDVEGYDKSILESSANFIDRLRPVLFVEWFFAYTEVETQDLFRVIKQLDYVPYHPETLQPSNTTDRSEDLLLIHRSKIKEYFNE